MVILVKDCMIKTFTKLWETMSPQEVSSQLPSGTFGVVLDDKGLPVALVTAEDVKSAANHGVSGLNHPLAGLPPIIITGSEMEMQVLAGSDAITLFDVGARGAVVMENNEVIGVLPADTITDYIVSGELTLSISKEVESAVVDTGLSGSLKDISLGRIRCSDSECGFVNTIIFIDENNLPTCQNPDRSPHTLVLP